MNILKKLSSHSAALVLATGVAIGAGAYFMAGSGSGAGVAIADPPALAQPIAGIEQQKLEDLQTLDKTFADLVSYLEPSVVHIRSESTRPPGGQFGGAVMGGVGSGIVFRSDGWIVTNDHVVNGFDKVTVVLTDGREFPGKVYQADDPTLDVALVKINAPGLQAARFGDSRNVRPGQFALAIGSPFGLENSVTIGHISALARNSQVGDARRGEMRVYSDLIQTDAPLNQGNSGGPLINVQGEVIGLNSAIFSQTGGNAGIGFAIPSNTVRLVAETLIEKGKVVRGYLGLIPENLKGYQLKEMNLNGGAIVADIPNDGPAARAGIKQNDVILKIGTYNIVNQQDVRNAMLRYSPGSTVPIEISRDGKTRTVDVKLASVPKEQLALNVPNEAPNMRGGPGPMPDFPGMDGLDDRLFRRFGIPPLGRNDGNTDVPAIRQGAARLGVTVEDLTPDNRNQFGVPANVSGAVVTSVEPGSVASKAGLEVGTVIQKFNNKAISKASDLTQAMKGVKWGETRQLTIGKYGKRTSAVSDFPVTFR